VVTLGNVAETAEFVNDFIFSPVSTTRQAPKTFQNVFIFHRASRTLLLTSGNATSRDVLSSLQGNDAMVEYPDTERNLVWRYMDLPKFLDLIQTSELHFTRLDQLEDPYEHAIQTAACRRKPLDGETMYVNCWILSEYESAAMWTIYGGNSGVAVQSSRWRIGSVLEPPWKLEGIKGWRSTGSGRVQYLDNKRFAELLTTTGEPLTNVVPVFNKRMSFSHEQEFRLAIGRKGEHQESSHVRLRVDLNDLIERIYVSPTAPAWIFNVAKRAAEKYGIEQKVTHSELLSLTLT
jgi:hypothetical protein